MNFDKIKSAIGTVAPWIAGSFGTPAMGAAVGALCQVFGLDAKTATAPDIEKAIAGATPEQLLALKQADNQHSEFMAKLGYDSLSALYANVADARNREVKMAQSGNRDRTPQVLSFIGVVAFFAVLVAVMVGYKPDDSMRDGFWMLVGAVVATYKDIYGYFIGSSSGSAEKNDLIKRLTNPN